MAAYRYGLWPPEQAGHAVLCTGGRSDGSRRPQCRPLPRGKSRTRVAHRLARLDSCPGYPHSDRSRAKALTITFSSNAVFSAGWGLPPAVRFDIVQESFLGDTPDAAPRPFDP